MFSSGAREPPSTGIEGCRIVTPQFVRINGPPSAPELWSGVSRTILGRRNGYAFASFDRTSPVGISHLLSRRRRLQRRAGLYWNVFVGPSPGTFGRSASEAQQHRSGAR